MELSIPIGVKTFAISIHCLPLLATVPGSGDTKVNKANLVLHLMGFTLECGRSYIHNYKHGDYYITEQAAFIFVTIYPPTPLDSLGEEHDIILICHKDQKGVFYDINLFLTHLPSFLLLPAMLGSGLSSPIFHGTLINYSSVFTLRAQHVKICVHSNI